MSGGSRK
ncbi:hypothetical protein D030_4220A, partial [Vibrio parahaemolyticus AQ3810]